MCIFMETIHIDWSMRTNIDIDDGLMRAAMRASGLKTKKSVVEQALRLLVRRERQKGVVKLFGKIPWEGDLDAWRRDKAK